MSTEYKSAEYSTCTCGSSGAANNRTGRNRRRKSSAESECGRTVGAVCRNGGNGICGTVNIHLYGGRGLGKYAVDLNGGGR